MSAPIATEMRLDAKAFRENTVYDSNGDPIRLIANAERMELAADTIEALLDLVIQYRDDLRHPPAKESIERRLNAINKALVKAGAA